MGSAWRADVVVAVTAALGAARGVTLAIDLDAAETFAGAFPSGASAEFAAVEFDAADGVAGGEGVAVAGESVGGELMS